MSELKVYKPYANRDGDMFLYHKGDEDLMLDDEDEIYLKDEADKVIADKDTEIAELKQKLEDAKASHYAEMVDAGMRERRLRRALWLARAERAKTMAKLYSKEAELTLLREHYPSGCGFCHIMNNKWRKVERKCRAKAED